MWMGGPLWPPAVALGLGIRALHRQAATRAPTPPNSSPAPTRDPSPGHFLFLLPLRLMRITPSALGTQRSEHVFRRRSGATVFSCHNALTFLQEAGYPFSPVHRAVRRPYTRAASGMK